MAVGAQYADEFRHKPKRGFERGEFGNLASDMNIDSSTISKSKNVAASA